LNFFFLKKEKEKREYFGNFYGFDEKIQTEWCHCKQLKNEYIELREINFQGNIAKVVAI
jgi:hypothetical protein